MKGLKDLLLADKLNSQALQLQLTAQSQVQFSLLAVWSFLVERKNEIIHAGHFLAGYID